MPFTSDSSSDECLDQDLPWSQIEDKFRGLLISRDLSKIEIIDFLETFLKFIRNGPKESRSFTRCIFKYLLATKNLISNTFVEESCYVHIKNILVIYCVLELRLTTSLHDESAVASNIITKIFLLMQRSKSVTILDALIDIDEIIRSSRSKSVMAIVYRHFLTSTPAGPPRVLDDNTFIKHLILYRSWYSAEVMNGKVNVFKRFSSTIKPTEELRTNQSYSLLGIDEVVDYKKLLQQPLPRNALIRALRDAESDTDSQNDDTNSLSLDELLDLTTDDETAMKVEVDLTLNLPDETILVDDEDDSDDDSVTISYLPKLFERWDAIDECEWRVAVLQHPRETSVYDGVDESSTHRTAKKVTFGSVTTRVYEVCDDEWCDDESYTDEFDDHDSGSDVSNTDSFSSDNTGPQHNFPSVTNRTDHSSYQLISEGNQDNYSVVAKSKHRKKKRSHFGKPIARCSIDDWMKRKILATRQCVASRERVKNCRITLKRLADHGQISGTKSGNTDPQFGKVDFSDWSDGSSTKSSAHTVSQASKSVMQSTEKERVMLPVTAPKNCPGLGLKKCTVRLKRLPSSQLHPTSTSSKKIRKCKNVQTTDSQGAYETKTFFESSSPSDCGVDFSPPISSKRVITTYSTDEETLSESTSMESFPDQTEEHLTCSPDTTTLLTSQSLPSTQMNTEIWLDNDMDANCATSSDMSVTTSLKIEFVDCENDKPSPMNLPRNDKRKNDKRSESTVNLSDIADASKSDDDEISAITNFIASASVSV